MSACKIEALLEYDWSGRRQASPSKPNYGRCTIQESTLGLARNLSFDEIGWAHFTFQRHSGQEYWKVVGRDPASPGLGVDIFHFLNAWQCRITRDTKARRQIMAAIEETWESLRPETYVCDLLTFRRLPQGVFDLLSQIRWPYPSGGSRTLGATATGKILHVLRPDVFVMWDAAIRDRYGVDGDSTGYESFIQTMAMQALSVIRTFHEVFGKLKLPPEEFLCRSLGCGHPRPITLAKLLDEYNWVAITNGVRIPPLSHS